MIRAAILAWTMAGSAGFAQSIAASLSGTVQDQQQAVVVGATVSLRNLDTGLRRDTTTDTTGHFRVMGVAPGRYEVRIELPGFTPFVVPDMQLLIGQEATLNATLAIASVVESTTVAAGATTEGSRTSLGRTFVTRDIDELPVAARDFNNVALLAPGILVSYSTGRNPNVAIATSGQIGRNNTFLLDGMTVDDHLGGLTRGGVSLDAVKEFVVLSNNFGAEYGQASGAIVSALTRSGTNQLGARVYYHHRDHRWDATDPAVSLAVPPEDKTRFEGRIVGGFIGGPLRRDRAFYFSSIEHTARDTESIVTSSLLKIFRPNASSVLPARFRNPQLLGRSDVNLSSVNTLTLRYRLHYVTETQRITDGGPRGLVSPERRSDFERRDQDVVLTSSHIFGSAKLNEFRFQFARTSSEDDAANYCTGCAAENRPGILLGKAPIIPGWRAQDRWQFSDAFTWFVTETLGHHTLKTGIDASIITGTSFAPGGFDGIWRFTDAAGDLPFDASNHATYPFQYTLFTGDPVSDLGSRVYAVFLQDQWKPTPRLTLNLGMRWDYEDAVGASRDRDNIAPRLGVALDPWKNARLVVRGGYGIYYDAILFRALNNSATGSQITQTLIQNPGYPDPYGFHPLRTGLPTIARPSVNRFADEIRTPYTEQVTAGVQHVNRDIVATADWVWARGHNLLRTRDSNYPDLTRPDRQRPDPNFQRVRVRETEGHSWYRALLLGIQKRHSRSHSFGIAYTLSKSERDTEDWEFFAADQRDYDAERGPSSSDVRHRVAATLNVDLPLGLQLATILTAQSALPFNITTGTDSNRDGEPSTDRPPGVGRNSARGADFWQWDVRVAKQLVSGTRQVEVLVEGFNLANRRNWIDFDGNLASPTYGRPTAAASPRQIQVGIRIGF